MKRIEACFSADGIKFLKRRRRWREPDSSQYVFLTYHLSVNSINWQPRALKQLRKIEARAGQQIRTAVTEELADLTKARNVKVLTKHEYPYRLRVGSYRVFFEFDGTVSIITIEQVRKRDERTY